MINKYFGFINESHLSLHEIENSRDSLVKELDKEKEFLISKITWKNNKVFYKDFENINVEEILNKLEKKLGEEVVTIFNVETFLRKIYQILELGQRSTKRNVRDEFTEYYISMDRRVEALSSEEKNGDIRSTPYKGEDEKSILHRDIYEKEKYDIQIELLKMQESIMKNGERLVIVFEGRDSAGKGSTIKRFTEHLNPKGFRVVALGIPTEEEKENWLERYEKLMPKEGEIVFFDRSWYGRAVVEPAMGYCTEDQYRDFMNEVVDWEESLIKDGITLIKFWFSITKEKQQKRFEIRKKSPLKYWKFSPNDEKSVSKWNLMTYYKNQMFNNTSTPKSPWVVINSNDKRIARLNSMRYVLCNMDYDDKNDEVCEYYPEVINILK